MNRLQPLVLSLAPLLALLLTAPVVASPGEVWVVDDGGGADFTDVQPAIDAGDHGDTILIRPGSYGSFSVVDKAVSLVADGGQPPRIHGLAMIAGLAADHSVSVAGLNLRKGLIVIDCDGHVLCSDLVCETPGLTDSYGSTSHLVSNCLSVVFSRCSLAGRDGDTVFYKCDTWDGIDGENGLDVDSSRVALYGCLLQGGTGGDSYDGGCWACEPAFASDGGDGVRAVGSSELYLDETAATGGLAGGEHDWCDPWFDVGINGKGVRLLNDSQLTLAVDPVLSLEGPTVVRADEQAQLVVTGPAGASAMLLWSETPDWRELGPVIGPLHLESQGLHVVPLGSIPGSGVLAASFTPPPIPVGEDARRLFVQVFALASPPGRILGTPSSLEVVDPAF